MIIWIDEILRRNISVPLMNEEKVTFAFTSTVTASIIPHNIKQIISTLFDRFFNGSRSPSFRSYNRRLFCYTCLYRRSSWSRTKLIVSGDMSMTHRHFFLLILSSNSQFLLSALSLILNTSITVGDNITHEASINQGFVRFLFASSSVTSGDGIVIIYRLICLFIYFWATL